VTTHVYERIISGAVYLAFHPVRQMEWLIIWKLSKSLTKCDNPCVQKNHKWCSVFGFPSSKADGVTHNLETKQIVDKM
jgi:hypothetical protein